MEYIRIGNHTITKKTATTYKIIYLISGIALIFMGVLLTLISYIGIAAIALGIFSLYNSVKYSKALKDPSLQSPEPAPSYKPETNQTHDISSAIADVTSSNAKISSSLSTKCEVHHVAGTSYRQTAIKSLGSINDDYRLSKKDFIDSYDEYDKVYELEFWPRNVELIEEPDNEYDPNAIKVVIDGVHVGYIKKGSCSHVKKILCSDKLQSISAEICGGNYKYYVCEYDEDKDKDVYTIEKRSTNFFVSVEISVKE